MNFSLSTVINTTIATNLLICLITLLMSSRHFMGRIKIRSIFLACVLITVRFLFPCEFFFTRSIYAAHLWGGLYPFLYRDFYIGGIRFEIFYIIFIVWMTGVLLLVQKFLISYRKTRRAAEILPPVTDTHISSIAEKINASFTHPVSIRLAAAEQTVSPCIIGIRHPVMILPDTELSDAEWHYIIRHELTHYYSRHLHLKLLVELLSAVYFFNPLMLLLKRRIKSLMEFSVDAAVTNSLTAFEKVEYAECLTKMARMYHERKVKKHYGIAFTDSPSSGLSQRVQMILTSSPRPEGTKVSRIFSGSIFLFLLVSYLFIFEPIFSDIPQNPPNFSLDPSDTYYRPNPDGSYDVINNGNYIVTVTQIFDENIPIKED